jgi:hypothetical protein
MLKVEDRQTPGRKRFDPDDPREPRTGSFRRSTALWLDAEAAKLGKRKLGVLIADLVERARSAEEAEMRGLVIEAAGKVSREENEQ